MIRILLVDDQNLVQQGIKVLLERDPDIKVIGTVKDGRSAVLAIEKLCPDVVLLDIEMPGMDGITATKYITHLAPQTKVIILSSHEEKKYLTQALMAGAKSYILKDSLMRDLKQSIVSVHNGYTQIESRLLAKIFDPSSIKRSKNKRIATQEQAPSVRDNSQTKKREIAAVASDLAIASEQTVFPDPIPQAGKSIAAKPSRQETVEKPEVLPSEPIENETSQKSIDLEKEPVAPVDLPDINPVNLADCRSADNDTESKLSQTNCQPFPKVINRNSKLSIRSKPQESPQLASDANSYLQRLKQHPQVDRYLTKSTKFWAAKQVRYQPQINWYRSKSRQLKTQALPIIKQWYEKGWLANAGLVLLGLITVLIVHRMFD